MSPLPALHGQAYPSGEGLCLLGLGELGHRRLIPVISLRKGTAAHPARWQLQVSKANTTAVATLPPWGYKPSLAPETLAPGRLPGGGRAPEALCAHGEAEALRHQGQSHGEWETEFSVVRGLGQRLALHTLQDDQICLERSGCKAAQQLELGPEQGHLWARASRDQRCGQCLDCSLPATFPRSEEVLGLGAWGRSPRSPKLRAGASTAAPQRCVCVCVCVWGHHVHLEPGQTLLAK